MSSIKNYIDKYLEKYPQGIKTPYNEVDEKDHWDFCNVFNAVIITTASGNHYFMDADDYYLG